jgi:hypothetical protein
MKKVVQINLKAIFNQLFLKTTPQTERRKKNSELCIGDPLKSFKNSIYTDLPNYGNC